MFLHNAFAERIGDPPERRNRSFRCASALEAIRLVGTSDRTSPRTSILIIEAFNGNYLICLE